ETELQILELDQELRTEVLKELREIETRSGELVERKAAVDDQLRRIEIRSPQDGVVHQLAVHTVGGVIGPGEVVMLVVPRADAMTIEAQIAPQDIDQVTRGQLAMVRLSAFSQRTTPELAGRVMLVAADLTRNPQNGAAYYIARIELPESELSRLQGLRLVPGMPAEVHIQTGERTALSYFLKPLSDQIARAFKED
ncbi:MAG: HlyD family type I secretion periplasmic adaptor subunit, partial [Rhabdaerophilum calidifontis]